MYGLGLHPLLDFVSIAGGLVLGYVFANDARGPLARMSPLARWTGMLVAAFFGIGVLGPLLGLLNPLVNGVNNAPAVLEFLGGVALLVAVGAAYLTMRGDLRIHVQRRDFPNEVPIAPPATSTIASSSVANGAPVAAERCPHCSRPLKPGAVFCSGCGSNVGAPA
jgi:hypothetical protein